jgi:hypothetical protein
MPYMSSHTYPSISDQEPDLEDEYGTENGMLVK